jgi:glyoxylase-like metal-dependent hydrolase (beta-lactamase superfamily II)
MSVTRIAPNVYRVGAGGVAAFLIDDGPLSLIDTGQPGKDHKIMAAVRRMGRLPTDVKNILITHYHRDHVGGLATLAQATRAKVYAPAGDVELIRHGGTAPALESRGLIGTLLSRFVKMTPYPPNPVHFEVSDGDELEPAGGIRVIHCPGHTPGHVSYLLPQHGGILFAGDAASNIFGRLGPMPLNEDFAVAERSFRALARLDFEVAGFGHGLAIDHGAARRFKTAVERRAASSRAQRR